MEYRGKHYSVVQGIEGGMWKWTADLDGHTKSGRASSRAAGIKIAEREIDRLLAPTKRRPGSQA
jgi:hypothetical protein